MVEELAFRGVIFERIRGTFGDQPAVIVVSVLFAVLHLTFFSFIPLAGLAMAFSVLRLRTKSLWPAICGHALFNLASLLAHDKFYPETPFPTADPEVATLSKASLQDLPARIVIATFGTGRSQANSLALPLKRA